jgi:hypothetical protein
MTDHITKAIAVYQAAITPQAIKASLQHYKSTGLPRGTFNADSIRLGAVMALRDVAEAEIERLSANEPHGKTNAAAIEVKPLDMAAYRAGLGII